MTVFFNFYHQCKLDNMKVLIQGLGEAPATIELALKKVKPDVTYILCSDYQLAYVHKGYSKPNREVVQEAARKANAKVIFRRCNIFDPESINNTIRGILKGINPYGDEVTINYAGGSAPVRLFLGVLGVGLSRICPKTRVLYAIHYPKDVKITANQTEKLQEFLPTDLGLLLSFVEKRSQSKRPRQR